jgi:hypothetical protein
MQSAAFADPLLKTADARAATPPRCLPTDALQQNSGWKGSNAFRLNSEVED